MSKLASPNVQFITIPNPIAPADVWTRETYRLIADFKIDFDRQQGAGASQHLGEGLLLFASDFLQARFGKEAHWDRLDVIEMLDRYPDFAAAPGFAAALISVLSAFYCYLGNIGRVAPEHHARMRQLGLDCFARGVECALSQLRDETMARCETKPSFCSGRARANYV